VSTVDKLLVFRLGTLELAVDAEEVLATSDWIDPTPLPFSPEAVKGIVSIDGRMFTVLEVGRIFGAAPLESRKLMIAFRGDEQLAVAIDGAESEIEVNSADITWTPEAGVRTVRGVWHRNGHQVQVIEPGELFSSVIQGRERRRRRL
jgi:chemotaxis signal transduction protein